MSTIYNYASTPQSIEREVFVYDDYDSLPNCTLYVPEESVELYQTANVWKEFNPILAHPQTEVIDNILAEEYENRTTKKISKDGQILILRGDKTYTLQGQEVK